MSYQVIKLANGEDIVCNLVKRFGSKIEVTSPLRMDTITKETAKGTMESLALSRWVQPYSDEKVFNIESNSVVIMTPASVGLSRYYEYVLKNIKEDIVETPPTKKVNNGKIINKPTEIENTGSCFPSFSCNFLYFSPEL